MNTLDRFIGFFSPRWAVDRVVARATLNQIEGVTNGKSGYNAGKLNRFTKGRFGASIKENEIPSGQIDRIRAQSWDLYRNNTYARKIVRNILSKVIGKGLVPESLAVNADGTPNVAFREKAKVLWASIQSGFDRRGMPGHGGLTTSGLQKLALKAVILSGHTLYRLVPIEAAEQLRRDLPMAFTLQLIDAGRLADSHLSDVNMPEGHHVCRGIEYDAECNRVAYHIHDAAPGRNDLTTSVKRIPAAEIGHLYVEDDIDQDIGIPWFAPAILQARDTGDLQYNVLKASAMAACVVMGYRKPTGAQRFGLNSASENNPTSADGTDLTDEDGNAITKIQPGMFINLGRDGAIEGFSPNQPNINAEGFIQHMLRGIAAGMPGVKSSSVTGDYRASSFSSEKSADNDAWPEIEDVQDWFATSFCQPIFESVLRAAVLSGYFDGIVSADEFAANVGRFTATNWQGPVSRSINPTDDANAAGLRMKYGISSLQMECAKLNVNWLDVLNHIDELYEQAESRGIPQEVINNILGVTVQSVTDQPSASGATAQAEPPSDSQPVDDAKTQSEVEV